LEKRPEFRTIKSELTYCREVRNFLQHNPKIDSGFAVEPSLKMVELLTRLIEKLKNPLKSGEIAIPMQDVYWKKMDDLVLPTMHDMKKNTYTHVPILEDGRVIGVFSDNTLFAYILEDGIIGIDATTKFHDIKKHLEIKDRPSEIFKFAKFNTMVSEIEDIFEIAFRKNERIGMIFLTEKGSENEKLRGIITPWDLIAKDEDHS
jgi:predicted transcriptional regulator